MRGRVLILLSFVSSPISATAIEAQPVQPAPVSMAPVSTIDSNMRRDVVAKLSQALRDDYIFPDVGEKAAEEIGASLAAGEYDQLSDPNTFAARLSSDVAAIAHDKHLRVLSRSAPPARPPGADGGMPHAEAGVTRADKLAGGIGYIEVVGFPPLPLFKPTIDKAMSALKGSRALIIDDRRNGGGSPDGVAYLVSFLVAPKRTIEITDIVSRVPRTNTFTRERHFSQPTPVSFATIPVYVLTSRNTFSGGEEFAYDVQTHKLATVIGEVTGGGAHPTGPVDLGHGFVAMIPFARSEDPITKTNWEGVGVRPDVSAAADSALRVALTRAGGKPIADIATASTERLFSPRTTPLPGSGAALRKLLDAIASGATMQGIVAPQSASVVQANIPQPTELAKLGKLLSVDFWRATPFGGDEYKLNFANGQRKTVIAVDQDGRIVAMLPLVPLGPGE